MSFTTQIDFITKLADLFDSNASIDEYTELAKHARELKSFYARPYTQQRAMEGYTSIESLIGKMIRNEMPAEFVYGFVWNVKNNAIDPFFTKYGIRFDYYDPDTSHEEDVLAYWNTLSQFRSAIFDAELPPDEMY